MFLGGGRGEWDGLVGGVVFEQKVTKGTKGRGEGWRFEVGDFFLTAENADYAEKSWVGRRCGE